jgi:GntR family transcriptional regulator
MPTASGTSKYVAVREHLLTRIQAMQPGDQIPAEPVLCEEYGVSRITLRHAVDGLIADGHLVREHGKGTFVVEPQYRVRYRERFADAVTGFYSQQTSEGFSVTTQVIAQRVVLAGEPAASNLGISAADKVVELTRLRFVNGTIHHYVVTYLPFALFPDTAETDFTDGSLFAYLTSTYDVTLERNDLLVSIGTANQDVAEHLSVDIGEKLLKVDSTVFDANDRAVAHGFSYFTPQNSEISFGLHS